MAVSVLTAIGYGWGKSSTLLTNASDEASAIDHALRREEQLADLTRRRGDGHQKLPDIGEVFAQTASREWDLEAAQTQARQASKAGRDAVLRRLSGSLVSGSLVPSNSGTAAELFPDVSGVPGGRSRGACLPPKAIKDRKARALSEFGAVALDLIPSMTSSVQGRLLEGALACGCELALHTLLPLAGKHLPESIEYTPNKFYVESVDAQAARLRTCRAEPRTAHPLVVCAELQPALIVPALAYLEWDTDDLVAAILRLDDLLTSNGTTQVKTSNGDDDKLHNARTVAALRIGKRCLEGPIGNTEERGLAGMAGLQSVERAYVEALCECAGLLACELAKCAARAQDSTGTAGAGAVLRLIKHDKRGTLKAIDEPLKVAFVTRSRALRDVILSPRWRDVWTPEEIAAAHRFVLTNSLWIFSPSVLGYRLNCGRLDAVLSYCALLEHPHTPRSLKLDASVFKSAACDPPLAEREHERKPTDAYITLFLLIRGRLGWADAPEGATGWTLLALVCALLPSMLQDLYPNADDGRVTVSEDLQRLRSAMLPASHAQKTRAYKNFMEFTDYEKRTRSDADGVRLPSTTTANPILKAVLDAVLKAHDWSRLARWRAIEAAVHVCAQRTRRIVEASKNASNDSTGTPWTDVATTTRVHLAEATCRQIVDALTDSMRGCGQTPERPLANYDGTLFRLKECKAPLLAGMIPSWPGAPRSSATDESGAACALRLHYDQQLSDMGLGATVRLCETTGAVQIAPEAKGPLVRGCAAAHVYSACWDTETHQLHEVRDECAYGIRSRTHPIAAVLLIVRDIAAFSVANPELARTTVAKVLDHFQWHDNELFRLLLMVGVSALHYDTKQACCAMLLSRMRPAVARAFLRAKAPRMFAALRRPRAEIAAAAEARASPYGPQIGADSAHSWVVHARICEAHDTMLAWMLTCFPTSQSAILRYAGYETNRIPRAVRLQLLDRMLVGGATGYERPSTNTGGAVETVEAECYDVERVGIGFARMWRPSNVDPNAPVEMRTNEELWKIDPLRFLFDAKAVASFRAWTRPASIGHSPTWPASPLASAQALLLKRVLGELLEECANRDPHFAFPGTRTVRWSNDPADTAEVDVLETVAAMFPTQLSDVLEGLMRFWSKGSHSICTPTEPHLEAAWPQWWARVGGRARLDSLLDAVLRAAQHFLDRGFREDWQLVPLLRFLLVPCRCRVRSYTDCPHDGKDKADERVEAVLLDAWRVKCTAGHGPEGRAQRWAELGERLEWNDDQVRARDGTLPVGWSRAAHAWAQARGVQPGAAGAPSKTAVAVPERGQCRIRHIPAEYKPGERLRLCTSWGVFAFTIPNGVQDGVGITVELPKPQQEHPRRRLSERPDFVSISRFGEAGAPAPDDDEPVVTAHRNPADWTNDPEKKRQCIDLVSDDDEEAARKKQKADAGGCA